MTTKNLIHSNLPDMDEKGLCESAINWLNRPAHMPSDRVHYEAPRFIVDAQKNRNGVINIRIEPRSLEAVPPGEYTIRMVSNNRFEVMDGPYRGRMIDL